MFNVPGPMPELFAGMRDALVEHVDTRCAGFVEVVFSLHDVEQIRSLMAEAGFASRVAKRSQKTLDLPPPEAFLWQYVHSTPLAERVGQASEAQRAALVRDVAARWRKFAHNGGMSFDVAITTARGAE